jgi:hypothetical protein
VNAPTEAQIEAAIFALLERRAPGASICPSDAARALESDAADWRPLMPRVRNVAAALARQGRLSITQKGIEIDPQTVTDGTVKGPIRLRHA